METKVIFLTTATLQSAPAVRLMIDSLRSFGGELSEALVWVFSRDADSIQKLEEEHTRIFPLSVSDPVAAYRFGEKVTACAQAEELVPTGTRSLVWIDPICLIVQPPILFNLIPDMDAAFRPVHIQNIGLHASQPLDAFWKGIYASVGVDNISFTVTSFVDGQLLRPYFNSHAFSVNPQLGLMKRWYELFDRLTSDKAYQSSACADGFHKTFLFQALLSTLITASIEPTRLCLLPSNYNYPYNLQDRISADRKLASLNEAVCFVYEDRSIRPDDITGIEIHEPLRSWLETRMQG